MGRVEPLATGKMTRMTFHSWDSDQRQFNGFGPAPFPDARDALLDEYVSSLITLGREGTSVEAGNCSENGGRVLGAYAERAATRIVRDETSDRETLLNLALVSLFVAGLDETSTDLLMPVALLEDAARRSQIDIAQAFERVSDLVGHPSAVVLMIWLSRDPESRRPEAMGFELGSDAGGFRYKYVAI